MPEEQRVGQQKQHRSDLVQIRCSTFGGRRLFSEHSLGASRVASRPGAESTLVGADWRHVRIHGELRMVHANGEWRITSAGEWRSRAFLDYIDGDKVDEVVFLNTTLNQSDEEDEAEAALAESGSPSTL